MSKMIAKANAQARAAKSRLASKDDMAVAMEEGKRRQRERTHDLIASRRARSNDDADDAAV